MQSGAVPASKVSGFEFAVSGQEIRACSGKRRITGEKKWEGGKQSMPAWEDTEFGVRGLGFGVRDSGLESVGA